MLLIKYYQSLHLSFFDIKICEQIVDAFLLCPGQGEPGQSNLAEASNADAAVKNFEKKFKEKTKNNWSDRDSFVSHAGKYTLIEVEGDQEAEVKASPETLPNYNHYCSSNFYIFLDVSTESNRQPH